MVMRKHQRYFPLYKPASQELLPHFITVANGPIDVPTVKVGQPYTLPFKAVHSLLLALPPIGIAPADHAYCGNYIKATHL